MIDTFRMAAALPADSLGAYVITMASRASDVLAVEWLQKLAGTAHPQRVVPLFERIADLQRAGAVLDALFTLPWYRARIAGHQEVMVGYSDSAKEAGRFAAAWALYRAQEQIVAGGRATRRPSDACFTAVAAASAAAAGRRTWRFDRSRPARSTAACV